MVTDPLTEDTSHSSDTAVLLGSAASCCSLGPLQQQEQRHNQPKVAGSTVWLKDNDQYVHPSCAAGFALPWRHKRLVAWHGNSRGWDVDILGWHARHASPVS
jgi:hypothetical protein